MPSLLPAMFVRRHARIPAQDISEQLLATLQHPHPKNVPFSQPGGSLAFPVTHPPPLAHRRKTTRFDLRRSGASRGSREEHEHRYFTAGPDSELRATCHVPDPQACMLCPSCMLDGVERRSQNTYASPDASPEHVLTLCQWACQAAFVKLVREYSK